MLSRSLRSFSRAYGAEGGEAVSWCHLHHPLQNLIPHPSLLQLNMHLSKWWVSLISAWHHCRPNHMPSEHKAIYYKSAISQWQAYATHKCRRWSQTSDWPLVSPSFLKFLVAENAFSKNKYITLSKMEKKRMRECYGWARSVGGLLKKMRFSSQKKETRIAHFQTIWDQGGCESSLELLQSKCQQIQGTGEIWVTAPGPLLELTPLGLAFWGSSAMLISCDSSILTSHPRALESERPSRVLPLREPNLREKLSTRPLSPSCLWSVIPRELTKGLYSDSWVLSRKEQLAIIPKYLRKPTSGRMEAGCVWGGVR